MFVETLERAADSVLSRYPLPASERASLGNAGGFSGARLWKITSAAGTYCLKAWPADRFPAERLVRMHSWMISARSSDLRFVPNVIHAADGSTVAAREQYHWDLTDWMPGRAAFRDNPTPSRIAAACSALATLHAAWGRTESRIGPCSAVQRRLAALEEWLDLVRSGWRPAFATPSFDPVTPAAERAWRILPALVSQLPTILEPHKVRPVLLHPCLCDIWHDHVLFEGDVVSGVIDYGSMRIDSPATDLARLLGSMAGDDQVLFRAGMNSYLAILPNAVSDPDLVRILDWSGTVLGAANWLIWLYRDHREFEDRTAAARRLRTLVERMEVSSSGEF